MCAAIIKYGKACEKAKVACKYECLLRLQHVPLLWARVAVVAGVGAAVDAVGVGVVV